MGLGYEVGLGDETRVQQGCLCRKLGSMMAGCCSFGFRGFGKLGFQR